MRTAHFDCFNGISGDMALAALLDAGVLEEAIRAGLESLGLPIRLEVAKIRRGGFAATQITIHARDEQSHRYLPDIEAILQRGRLTTPQRELASRMFRRLAEAEATVHGVPIEQVHFHEVGALDSIADIVGTAIGLTELGVERFTARSVPTGSGTVKCAHGIMPIPTPATVELLKGVPLARTHLKGELTTPTGATILTSVVSEWHDDPGLIVERVGLGAGTKDFSDVPNVLRLLVGRSVENLPANHSETDSVWILETNLDDTTPEIIGYTVERLFEAGALDAFTQAIQMKKNRPGILLTVIAPWSSVEAFEEILFRETGTLGIRRTVSRRRKLQRSLDSVETKWGPIAVKRAWNTAGVSSATPEYEDCRRVARLHRVPLREVYRTVEQSLAAADERGA